MICQKTNIHDYIQLSLFDGSLINIYHIDQCSKDLDGVVGDTISSIGDDGAFIEIDLDSGKIIRIEMAPDNFDGPETMSYNKSDGSCIVWAASN
jgi:hypothetical protein